MWVAPSSVETSPAPLAPSRTRVTDHWPSSLLGRSTAPVSAAIKSAPIRKNLLRTGRFKLFIGFVHHLKRVGLRGINFQCLIEVNHGFGIMAMPIFFHAFFIPVLR